MNDLPGDLYYTNEHEWLRKEEDGSITCLLYTSDAADE